MDVFFDAELYNLDLNYTQKLITDWRVCARKVLNVNSRTRSIFIQSLFNCKKNLNHYRRKNYLFLHRSNKS